jgi:hypothetical protein
MILIKNNSAHVYLYQNHPVSSYPSEIKGKLRTMTYKTLSELITHRLSDIILYHFVPHTLCSIQGGLLTYSPNIKHFTTLGPLYLVPLWLEGLIQTHAHLLIVLQAAVSEESLNQPIKQQSFYSFITHSIIPFYFLYRIFRHFNVLYISVLTL